MSTNQACKYGCMNGYIIKQTERGPMSYKCHCLQQEIDRNRFRELIRTADIEGMEDMTFEKYQPQNPSQIQALQQISGNHAGFYIYGSWGVGKTHLATATVLRELRNGVQAVRISVPRLLHEIRKQGREKKADIEDMAKSIPYLVLDDLGKEKTTDWTEERLFELADARYTAFRADKGHTTCTSNYPLKLLAQKIDGAIVDRIRGMCKEVLIEGKSFR